MEEKHKTTIKGRFVSLIVGQGFRLSLKRFTLKRTSTFIDEGGDSLAAVELINILSNDLNVELPIERLASESIEEITEWFQQYSNLSLITLMLTASKNVGVEFAELATFKRSSGSRADE
ncbi:MAG: acyl carrier protein [Opitutaceae bacterium]|nr:acyl carrier protein [Opitutaceae bacterium]